MHKVVIDNDVELSPYYKKISDDIFCEMFKSMQLLAFTVLYYDFGFSREEMIQFNDMLKADNSKCLDDFDEFDKAVNDIKKYSDFEVEKRIKEFPYSARVKMCNGIPTNKKNRGLAMFNLFNIQSLNAIDSYMVLALSQLIRHKKWRKAQVESFWGNLKRNASDTYAKGMKDEFIVEYFKNEIELELRG